MQRILLLALLVTAALSGCLSTDSPDASTPDGTTPVVASGQPTFVFDGDGNLLDESAYPGEIPQFEMRYVTQRISGEPTLGVTLDGAVVYASIDFDASAGEASQPFTKYFRSFDAGLTWEDVTPDLLNTVPTHPITGDPYVHVDPDTGRIFALDMNPSVVCNTVSWSDDNGKTWSAPRHGACPLPVSDHPTIFTGPGAGLTSTLNDALEAAPVGYPNVVYLCSNQIVQAKCAYSLTGGYDWEPAVLVFPGVDVEKLTNDPASLDGVCSGFTSHSTTSRVTGTVYVPRSLCGVPALSLSRDGGMTYEYELLFPEPEYQTEPGVHDTMVAVDEEGTAYYFWSGQNGTVAYLSVSTDDGATWSTPMNVTAPGVTGVRFPGIAAGLDGRIAIHYMGTENPRGLQVGNNLDEGDNRQIWENATWNSYVVMSLNANDENPVFVSTTVNDIAKPLKRGECEDRCPGNGREGGPYDFLDVEIDPITGTVYAAMVDVCTGFCDEPGVNANAPQRSFGAIGVQVGGTRLLDGTEYDRR